VQSDEVANLPLNGRNYINLTLMQPGIGVAANPAQAGATFNGTWYSSNGATMRSNNFMLDGAHSSLSPNLPRRLGCEKFVSVRANPRLTSADVCQPRRQG
jgi:hypothetical protein